MESDLVSLALHQDPHHCVSRKNEVTLKLSHEEHVYIVASPDTDLALTELGMRLIEVPGDEGKSVIIEGTQVEYMEFLETLREEYLWKSTRLPDPHILIGLAQKLLPDFESIVPMKFC